VIARVLVALARVLSGAQVRWTQPLAGDRQRIYFANHTSHLDFVLLWSSLPPSLRERARPVAGRDYWERGRIRRYLSSRVFNAVLIDRPGVGETADRGAAVVAARAGIQRMAEAMGDRWSLIVFPEGTRGNGADVAPFKSGLYHLAMMRPEVELVPVYLDNMNRILPKGESLPVPMLGRVIFGAPMHLEAGEDKGVFLARARETLVRLRAA
jgi:1-acyl-sn-glycerol-3-phosphate acyltransferase